MVPVATNWDQTTSSPIPNQVPLLWQRCPKNAILLCLLVLISYSCDLSLYKTCSVVEGSLIPSLATNFLSSQVRQVWTPWCCSLTERESSTPPPFIHLDSSIHPFFSLHLSIHPCVHPLISNDRLFLELNHFNCWYYRGFVIVIGP